MSRYAKTIQINLVRRIEKMLRSALFREIPDRPAKYCVVSEGSAYGQPQDICKVTIQKTMSTSLRA